MKKKSKKWRIPVIPLVVISVIIIILLCVVLLKNKEVYKIEERTKNITEYQKKNTEYDVDGWLRVQGTNIDYPVIIDNAQIDLTSITDDFLWRREKTEELQKRTVILGHNLKNVSKHPLITDKNHSRFEQLMSFIYYDFAQENQYIQYTKNGKNYVFKIFSVSFIDDNDLMQTGYLSKEELKEYIEKSLEDSYFKYDVEVDENDKIITLITCTRFFGGVTNYRFKIEGKLIPDDEKITLSKVSTKENYKKIEDIMKGGVSNETEV